MNYKLSLCITTYNRGNILAKCLESIVSQSCFGSEIEIVISDNASTDNTYDIVTKFKDKFPNNIFYYKNEINLGMEKNILKALELGRGKLLRLLNDYTIFNDGALGEILKTIDDNSDECHILFYINFKIKNHPIYCDSLDSFFKYSLYWITFMGSFSIWKKDYDYIINKNDYLGLMFPHSKLLIENFMMKNRIIIYSAHYANNADGIVKGGYNFFEVFVNNFIGGLLEDLYNKRKISLWTIFYVKYKFMIQFLRPWTIKIYNNEDDSYSTFEKSGIKLLYKYYKFHPEYYLSLINIHMVRILKKYRCKNEYN